MGCTLPQPQPQKLKQTHYLVFHNNFTSSIIVAMSTYSRKPILASAHNKFSNFLELLTLTKRFLDSNSFSFEVHTLPEVFATALLEIEFFFIYYLQPSTCFCRKINVLPLSLFSVFHGYD